MVLSALAFVDQ